MAIIIDNVNSTLKNDLERTIKKHEKISVAAGCFSMYAWQELKKRLDEISELRFIFTEPTFIAEKTPAALREFYIPRRDRERSLYGTDFESETANIEVLMKTCKTLDCNIGDTMDLISEEERK